MPFKDILKRFGIGKKEKTKSKPNRKHPYDEVSDEQIQTRGDAKRRPRAYDEIEIDDEDGPTMVDGSPEEKSKRTTCKSLNYIEVDVQPPDNSSEVRRSEPPTQYTTVEVAADASSSKRKVSIDLQE